MADRRRRRPRDDGGEDEGTATDKLKDGSKAKPTECESEGEGDVLSEYESASEEKDKEEEGSEEETDSEEETETDDDDEDEEEEGYDEDVIIEDEGSWVEEERQSGDGEEQQEDGKNLDDDEDRKNPAYIPRKGAFYEHDTRMHGGGGGGTGEETPQEKEDEMRPKKKLWKDEDKWLHDRYRDDQQAPKSREELIAIYGYDIRAYDKPPENAPKRGGMGNKRGGRRGQRRLGDFVPSPRKSETSYAELANENEYRSQDIRSSDYRNQDNRAQYESRNKNYRNQSQDYRMQAQDQRPRDNRETRPQDYRNQDYGKYSQDGSQDYRNQVDSRQGYRGGGDYNQYQGDYSPRNNVDSSRSRGRGRGRGRGSRGRYNDQDSSYAQNRSRQSTSPREFTNSSLKNTAQDVDQTPRKGEGEGNAASEMREKSQSQDVVISNKENVQTISVTITNTTTEKKSYSKDRRNKVIGRTRVQDTVVNAVDPNMGPMGIEAPARKSPEESTAQGPQTGPPQKTGEKHPMQRLPSGPPKQDMAQQSRPKRYSSQRQRNVPDVNYSDQMSVEGGTFYNPDAPAYTPPLYRPDQAVTQAPQPSPPRHPHPQPQDAAAFQTTILQPPMGFPLPVSTAGMPNPPPRLFAPGPAPAVTMTAPSAIIQPQFLGAGVQGVPGVPNVVYGAPPGTFPLPVGFPPANPPPTQQVSINQQTPPAPAPQSGTGQELFRGGTTYYAPELQQPSPNRSPHKRPKAAIPIVDPTHQRRRAKNEVDMVESTRESRPVAGAESEQEDTPETLEEPYPDEAENMEPEEQLTELSPPECSAVSTSEGHVVSQPENSAESNSLPPSVNNIEEEISQSSETNCVPVQLGASSEAKGEESSNVVLEERADTMPEEPVSEAQSLSTDSAQVDQNISENSTELQANVQTEETSLSKDHISDLNSGSCKGEIDSASLDLAKDLSSMSVNEGTGTVSNPEDEKRKPHVKEFCVRKDLEVADMKPSVMDVNPDTSISGKVEEYGGSKLQAKTEDETSTESTEATETVVETT